MAGFRPRPALAVVSPATRAQQTWEIARTALTREIDTRTEDAIYEASWVELLHVVQRLPSKHSCAIVVGHNPGLEDLVHELAGRADKAAARQLRTKYPTSAIAVLSSPQVWRQWDSGSARLDDLHIAR